MTHMPDCTINMIDLHSQYREIRGEIDRAVHDVIESSAFINGPAVTRFEKELAAFVNVRHCIACASGTDAITLSLMALSAGPGDEVIMPAFTFGAVAEATMLLGATPVLADIDPTTFNIDPAVIERLITPRTKAIIAVHLFGQPCDMETVTDIARCHSITVIEDNAQSLGATCTVGGATCCAGTVGKLGCTSFFPSKVLGCYGDGGAVFTDDDRLAERVRALANHGQNVKYTHRWIGLNSRLDSLQAAILTAKLPHLDRWIERRREIADRYTLAFAGLPGVTTPATMTGATHVFHQYTVVVPPQCRDRLRAALAGAGIASMVYYPRPLSQQPAYADRCICPLPLTNAERMAASVLSLPIHENLTDRQQNAVIETVRNFFTHRTR